jgi:hypothetical protein
MSKKSPHIQSSFIPAGMEYREEYMIDALSLYQHQKAKIRRRRMFYGIAALAILATSLLFVISDRDAQKKASDNSNTVYEQSNVNINDSAQKNNQSNSSAVTEKGGSDSKVSNESLNENSQPDPVTKLSDTQNSEHQNTENPMQTSAEKKKEINRGNGEKKNHTRISSLHASGTLEPMEKPLANTHIEIVQQLESEKDLDVQSNTKDIDSNTHSDVNSEDKVEKNNLSEFQNSIQSKVEENVSVISFLGFSPFFTGEQKLAPAGPMKVKYIAPERKDSYYLSAGTNVLSHFASNRKDFNLDPSFALGWAHTLNKNFSLGLESGYFSIAKINRPFETTSIKYGESFTATTTTIFTDRLHYLHVGPRFFFNQGSHQFELGYSLSYLLTGNNRLEVFSMSDSYTSPTASTKASGYVLGFTNFSHDLSLGYNYKIGRYASLGFSYHFGLTDITRNQYFTTSGKDFNSRLELHFKVNIR